ncbi:helix-turn-helix domain-containing protein [Limosilactobacillus gastricus]|uniref:helix-turn-helix domain-containing protein n=1 Tax=Limosilactobacillus gastricus TaxID=227942 RepID=UPI00070537FC|nr:helix-turn-helix domain-containing protein [Limosilactobacillus gastricus]QGF41143.1 helix-turn-helix domain-containing protein [Limosilactobacillus gastricus]
MKNHIKIWYHISEVIKMMNVTLKNLLDDNQITQTMIAETSGISLATINQTLNRPIDSWSIKILDAVAKPLYMSAGQLLDIINPSKFELETNDDLMTIQGVKIDNYEMYQQIRFAVENNVMEGWEPTKQDIEDLLRFAHNPDPEYIARYKEIFGDE